MGKLFLLGLVMFSSFGFAATQAEIDNSALELLLSKSGELQTEDGLTLSAILAGELTTDDSLKFVNSCAFNASDALYNCALTVHMTGVESHGTELENQMVIRYQLDYVKDVLEFFYYTVIIEKI